MTLPRREWIYSAVLSALLLAILTPWMPQYLSPDSRQYLRMVDDPFAFDVSRSPYSFRPLTPFLVKILPLDPRQGFLVITLGALFLCGVFLYGFLRATGLGRAAAFTGQLLFSTSSAQINSLKNPVLVDPLTFMLLAAAFFFLQKGRLTLFFAVVALGMLNKEVAILLLPLFLVVSKKRLGVGCLSIGSALFSVLVFYFLVIRQDFFFLFDKFFSEQGFGFTLHVARHYHLKWIVREAFFAFGFIWIIALLNIHRAPSRIRRYSVFILIVVATLPLAGDTQRVLMLSFPALLALGLVEIERASPRVRKLSGPLIVVANAVAINLHLLFESREARISVAALCAAIVFAALILNRWDTLKGWMSRRTATR